MLLQFLLPFPVFLVLSTADGVPHAEKPSASKEMYLSCKNDGVPIENVKKSAIGPEFDRQFGPLFQHPIPIKFLFPGKGLKCIEKIRSSIKKCDTNKDDKISLSEFKCVFSAMFDIIVDANKDKCITPKEMDTFIEECGLNEMEQEVIRRSMQHGLIGGMPRREDDGGDQWE